MRADDPITRVGPGTLFAMRPPKLDVSSESCFELATYWFSQCVSKHKKACSRPQRSRLPTRVLNVGDWGAARAVFQLTHGKHGLWTALSYCWGIQHPLKTIRANLEAHCEGISISKLPQIFRDAIIVTRQFGYRYLWIDSLCIIQDSSEDWNKESAKMAEIYSRAALTISADASQSAHHGMFESANQGRSQTSSDYGSWIKESLALPVHGLKATSDSKLYV